MDIIPARHRPDESDATCRSAESLQATWYRQQPADAGLAVSASHLQDSLIGREPSRKTTGIDSQAPTR
jgi:hypothetical protein